VAGLATALALLAAACSDSSGPSPDSFRAQLRGARTATLSGAALTDHNFVQEYPDHHFVIRMHAEAGDTVQTIALRCRGDDPPAPGSHSLGSSADEVCIATYSRIVVPPEGGATILGLAGAASGELNLESPENDQLPGVFAFSGLLVAEGDTVGTLQVSGSFSADRP
jgi:hypothetical protein